MTTTPEALFVCVHNAGRSQMAAALLDYHAAGRVTVPSAGSAPADTINPAVVEAMAEIGLDLSRRYPKPLTDDAVRAADVVITMGCGDACPIFPGKRYLDWNLPDPAGKTLEEVRPIRDEIDRRIKALLAELVPTHSMRSAHVPVDVTGWRMGDHEERGRRPPESRRREGSCHVSTPQPGDQFPDLELPDHTGNQRRLSELAAGDPLFLNFYRGFWCPKEQAFFRKLVRLQDEAEVAYTRFASAGIDPPEVAAAFRAGLGARWTFLSDTDRRYQAELDLLETTDTVHRPYLPASFLLLPDLRVHQAWNGYWFWGRPTNEELRQGFRGITRLIRPDWEVPRR